MSTSMAAGQCATPLSLASPAALAAASDAVLSQTAAAVLAEQHRRALTDNDLEAVLEDAFLTGFADNGTANVPWLAGGLLICTGYIRYKSATSHECSFTSVEGTWAWDHQGRVMDQMRQIPGPKIFKQAVTLIVPQEGMEIDVVASASKSGGACQMRKATSYQVRNGELVVVSSRARTPQGSSRG